MNWYTIRVTPGGGPGTNGDGAYTVADERNAEGLAAAYRADGALVLDSFSVSVRGTVAAGKVTLVAPHVIAIVPRDAPTN